MTQQGAAATEVTVIMVTYNSRHVLEESLAPLRGLRHVVVVDNASHDGTPEAVARLLPQARLIRNEVNVGFGRANNIGLARVTTPHALLLNPDCVLDAGALDRLLDAARRYPDAAILAPKVFLAPGRLGESFRPFYFRRQPEQLVEPQGDVCADWLIGAALFLNMEHMRRVGFFDPWFFLFYEEEDLCLRVREAGHAAILVSDAVAVHAGRKSSVPSTRLTFRIVYCMTLSRLYITGKYFGRLRLILKWSSVITGSLLGLPFYLLTLNKRLALRNCARFWAALTAPRELRASHCLEHRPAGPYRAGPQ
jgi:GT2 family glycosyltransferase